MPKKKDRTVPDWYTGPNSPDSGIADGSITLAKLASIATSRILGRITAGTGVIEALTGAEVTALLDVFTSALKGLVPASGGGTDNFLRADGLWATPSTVIPGIFGTGSDGVQDFDGSTAVLGVSPASDTIGDVTVNAYTQDRDWYLDDGSTIDDGVAILTDGYRLFINGKLVGPVTGMAYVGNWGNNGGDGTSTAGGSGGSARSTHLLAGGAAGGTGGNTSTGSSTGGSAVSNCPRDFSNSGGGGGTGAGGSGADGVAGRGGGGGANKDGGGGSGAGSVTVVSSASVGDLDNILQALTQYQLTSSITRFNGGSGGGGGRGQQFSPTGGGGGGGAGCGGAVVAIHEISGNVTLVARGGDGGDGFGSAGGGGGGGGGLLTVVYGAGSAPTTDVSGGVGGGSSGGTGGAGGDGGPGVAKAFRF